MISQRRLFSFLTILIFISLFLVACERPLGGTGSSTDQTDQTSQTDADVGGGTDGTNATTDASSTTTDAGSEAVAADIDAGATDGSTDESTTDASADADTAAEENNGTEEDVSGESGGGAGDADSTEQNGDSPATDEEQVADTADNATQEDTAGAEETAVSTNLATHIVAAGENLFRIGLKYNLSWVDIANENNLANPHILSVGQELKLPGATTGAPAPSPEPTPSPQTETTYIVKPGDTLYRIGLQYGISWVQIAEANGLVNNPNLIDVGSELKIPVNTPGPAPQFTHVVQPGETLFLISLQYGVTWPAIAEANDLASPYVIYAGQTLEIPGAQ